MPARHLGFAIALLALTLVGPLTDPSNVQAQGTGAAASPAPKAEPGPDQEKTKTGRAQARPKARRAALRLLHGAADRRRHVMAGSRMALP